MCVPKRRHTHIHVYTCTLCKQCFQRASEVSCLAEFRGIELWVLQRAIQSLAREGKAEIIPGESADGSDAGVKFFS